jgi:transcriptional regulator with XRE-family HTH domain
MNIGERLRDLRVAKKLSQGDIQKRTGLLRCYTSRVENGYTVPNLETLERMAKALDIEFYQLFYEGDGKPEAIPTNQGGPLGKGEEALLQNYHKLKKEDRTLILQLARDLAKPTKA